MEQIEHHNHDGINSPKISQNNVLDTYTEDEVVKLTTDQSVAGVKTFTSIPVLPASNPTTDNQAVRKAYVDDLIPGYEILPTDTVRDSASTGRITSETTPTKYKDITYNDIAGTIRVSFTLNRNSGGGTAAARVYKNGSAVGTERNTTSGTPATYTEDIAVAQGDEVQVYCWNTAGTEGYISGFQLKYDKYFAVTAGTVNND